ncbi:MAG: HAD-IIIA family hydrolase [Candidatus Eisenbacteria bacterium]
MTHGRTEKNLRDKDELREKLARVRAVFFDVDGVLTDGRIYLGAEEIFKAFSARDGMAIRVAEQAGLRVFLVTARGSQAVTRRAEELGVTALQDVKDKLFCIKSMCEEAALSLDEVAFVGDDLHDLGAMKAVGVSFAVSDACSEARSHADAVLESRGGERAAREVIERILRSQGKWEKLVSQFLS